MGGDKIGLDLDQVTLWTTFRRYVFLAGLEDSQLSEVMRSARCLQLVEGEILFHQGDRAEGFFLLESGLIELYLLSIEGEEKVIEIIQPGQSFAEAVMFFEKAIYPVNARAGFDSRLWRLEIKKFRQLLTESSETCLRLLGAMSQRLHKLMQEIDQLALHNATARVIKLLLQMGAEKALDRYTVEWQVPKHILASRLSIRPETFSRILQQLKQAGIIRVQGKKIEVISRHKLQNWPERKLS